MQCATHSLQILPDPAATTASLLAVAAVAAAHHNLGSKVWACSVSPPDLEPPLSPGFSGEVVFLAFFVAAPASLEAILPSSLSEELSLEPSLTGLVRLVPKMK